MKQYPWKFKLRKEGIEWWQSEKILGSDRYFYYFKIGLMDKDMRWAYRQFKEDTHVRKVLGFQTFGLHKFWYDCPHAQLNLYFLTIYWSTPWTTMPKDYWNKKENKN